MSTIGRIVIKIKKADQDRDVERYDRRILTFDSHPAYLKTLHILEDLVNRPNSDFVLEDNFWGYESYSSSDAAISHLFYFSNTQAQREMIASAAGRSVNGF